MATKEKPKATSWATDGKGIGGGLDETNRRRGETIRQATCPTHGTNTREFVGLNENGWIFRCAGLSQKQNRIRLRRNGLRYDATDALAPMQPWHYFVAEPADA